MANEEEQKEERLRSIKFKTHMAQLLAESDGAVLITFTDNEGFSAHTHNVSVSDAVYAMERLKFDMMHDEGQGEDGDEDLEGEDKVHG